MTKLIPGENDLKTRFPHIADEWDFEKNKPFLPEQFLPGSGKTFYWKCNNGHDSYPASIKDRTHGHSCRICGRSKISKGIMVSAVRKRGSLKDLQPDIAAEWDYEKNEDGPECYAPGSSKNVWWKCTWCNNSWPDTVYSRVYQNSGCPKCNYRNKTSFPEQAVFFYVRQVFPDAQNSYTELFNNNMELDVYIPSRSVGIEYDGLPWHETKHIKKDTKKYLYCKEHKITLIRIRESEKDVEGTCDAYVLRTDPHSSISLDNAIRETLNIITDNSFDISIDSERDRNVIWIQYRTSFQEKSLQFRYPKIAAEWHPDKNGEITPDKVSGSSREFAWWLCPVCGESYEKRISDRTNNGVGCPKCSSKKKSELGRNQNLIPNENDLATLFPDLIKEWDYEENKGIIPRDFTPGSDERVNWKCSVCGKKYLASICSRTHGSGCPVCGRKKAGLSQKQGSIKKYGSLREANPAVAEEWDYEANSPLTPDNVSPIDKQEYHWICKCGQKWTSSVFNLTHSKYVGCRKCRYQQAGQFRREHPEVNPFYGRHHSAEAKAKISAASKGEKNYFYGMKGELAPNYGKTFSDEHRAKISAALKGKKKKTKQNDLNHMETQM